MTLTVHASYLSGDEVKIPFASPLVSLNDFRVRIATLHSKFAPDVLVLTNTGEMLDSLDADVPSHVNVLFRSDNHTSENFEDALIQHARAGDADGVQRLISFVRESFPCENVGALSAHAILRFLRSSPPQTCNSPLEDDSVASTMKYLLGHDGVDLSYGDINGRTVLHCAAARGFDVVLNMILSHSPHLVDIVNSDESTALDAACYGGYVKCVEELLRFNANVAHTDRGGRSALDCASSQGHIKLVQRLVHAGADVNNTDNDGWSALSEASAAGHLDCVQTLIEANADCSLADQNGWTALSWAASRGHADVCEILCHTGGADVQHKSKSGWTPILLAQSKKHGEVLTVLNRMKSESNQ